MSNSQPNAWQTARPNNNRPSNTSSASRTPQNRSTNASPAPQNPSQPPKQPSAPSNVWTQRAAAAQQQQSTSSNVNGPGALQEETHTPLNGFNAAEVKGFLGRESAPVVYKVQEGQGGQRGSGGAWGSKANHMANGQPFFLQLAKQVATFEGGG
ncbi:hypothetical protein PRZ48_002024 [Zasmidium cellare]|uniref:Uncharacterized protein n=1 Tax=Zasmidium cellare TaxID=395010 RepID=A0ABR0F4K7_ZASCE|nr:hypothetical protein PRZ48_002024 [Zasmidium cellare]